MKFNRLVQTFYCAVLIFLATGCASRPAGTATAEPVEITVSAAASLTEAFTEISGQYEAANPGTRVLLNFGGSQELAQQIVQGAEVDVFASANQKQMGVVLADKVLPEDAAAVFAGNRLVVIYPQDNPGNLSALDDLSRPGLKLVFAGVEVPVGQYSIEFLDLAEQSGDFPPRFKVAVLDNVVSYENNVRSVLTKVSLGEADGGIVYTTDAASVDGEIGTLEIPAELNVNADYWILALPDSQHPEQANPFVEFVLSARGQQILEKYGFLPVQ